MFQNAYQAGSSVEIYDAKVNKDKEKSYAQLYRMTTPQGFSKIFDKDIKGYIFSIDGHSTKMRFPKDDRVDLCIIQNFLVFQIYLPFGSPWSLEIGISDTQKVNRRINLVSALNKIETKYFHVKAPNDIIKRGVWMNLSIDINSFMEAWKGSTFRSIDSITIGSACKLRRVYSMKARIFETNFEDDNMIEQIEEPPRNFSFPPGFPFINQLVTFRKILDNVDPKYQDGKTKNSDIQDHTRYGKGETQAKQATSGMPIGKSELSKGQITNKRISSPQRITGKQERGIITQDFQEKSMISIKKRDNSENTYQNRIVSRSPLSRDNRMKPTQYKFNPYTGQRENSPSNKSRSSDQQIEDDDFSPFQNSNLDKNQVQIKIADKIDTKVYGTNNIPKSPNPQIKYQQQNGSQSSRKPTVKIEDVQLNQNSAKTNLSEKSNPWYSSTNAYNSSQNRGFPPQQEIFSNSIHQEEEIDENIEAEYYDYYDEQQINSAHKKERRGIQNESQKHHHVNNNEEKQNKHGQLSQEQQRRASKSANNFGPQHNSSQSYTNQPHKIKKKLEKKQQTEDQFSQSINTTDLDEESYFQLTQKFNTVSDPNQFRDIFAPQKSEKGPTLTNKKQQASPQSNTSREIEEDIQEELNNNSPDRNRLKKQGKQSPKGNRIYEDSLEILSQKDDQQKVISSNQKQNLQIETPKSQSKGNMKDYNIYENHLNKFLTLSNRPFTPPFQSINTGNQHGNITNNSLQSSQVRGNGGRKEIQNASPEIQIKKHQKEGDSFYQKPTNIQDSLEVIYDKELNCYFDPTTKQYYDLQA